MKICEQCGAMLDAEERCACGRDAVLPPHRSFAHLTAVAEEWRFLLRAGAAACAEARIEPMRKEVRRLLNLSKGVEAQIDRAAHQIRFVDKRDGRLLRAVPPEP